MKVRSRCLSHLRLDQTYCLLDARGVSVVLELFKAIDIRGEMALDGNYPFFKIFATTSQLWFLFRYSIPGVHEGSDRPQ